MFVDGVLHLLSKWTITVWVQDWFPCSLPHLDFDPALGMMTGIPPINPMMPGLGIVPPPIPPDMPAVKEIIHCKSCTLFPPNPRNVCLYFVPFLSMNLCVYIEKYLHRNVYIREQLCGTPLVTGQTSQPAVHPLHYIFSSCTSRLSAGWAIWEAEKSLCKHCSTATKSISVINIVFISKPKHGTKSASVKEIDSTSDVY